MLIFHDPTCADYGSAVRPEQPARITATVPHLKKTHPDWTWRVPTKMPAFEDLLRAHTPEHIARLEVPEDFDADTPWFPGIHLHARQAVAAALAALEAAMDSREKAFALMRPPGHHATPDQAMGFCYLNQIAIAALAAKHRKGADRVAVWDFDAHHGNGTEAILDGREGFFFASVHQFPGYPGTGTRSTSNCRNWPVAPGTPAKHHRRALEQSWEAVLAFRPQVILVSAGFDAFIGDPITAMTLEAEGFAALGSWVRQAGLPTVSILEGGYSKELPKLIESYLTSWESPAARVN